MKPTTDQLKELLAKVTPGEWNHETGPAFKGTYNAVTDEDGELIADCWEKDDEQAAHDAALIALAPTLAAEVVRLRAIIEKVDQYVPVADENCDQPGIPFTEAIMRQWPELRPTSP